MSYFLSDSHPSERLIDEHFHQEDIVEKSLRPTSLNEFIGQKKLCDNLKIYVQAAKQRQEALDHVLFYGPPGLGKTTLAQIISKEMGVGFRATSAPLITKTGDLAAILTNLQPCDVLFIDEIHRLTPTIEEVLYPAMEDKRLDLVIGEGPSARTVSIDLAPFTLVGATTRSGLITAPLRERFGIPCLLNYYDVQDLCLIVRRLATLFDISFQEGAEKEIATRSRGTPRIAGRLLRRVRDFAAVEHMTTITQAFVDKVLNRLDVDKNGLDILDRRYLKCILEHYSGGPVGADTLAAALSEQRDMLEEVIEPFLLQKGFIQRTSRGRVLSKKGYHYFGIQIDE